MEVCLIGHDKLMKKNKIKTPEVLDVGTIVYLAKSGKFLGYVVVSDKIKEDSFIAIEKLKEIGIKNVSMFTGDNKQIALQVADSIKLDSCYYNLLPEDKVKTLEVFKEKNKVFVGDGINDAPVIASADVGVCMGGVGSDATIEISDVVLMNDEPSKIVDAIKFSKKTIRIINQNIWFILVTKLIVMALTLFGISSMWLAIFADVGVALLAVLNSLRVLLINDKKSVKKSNKIEAN